MGFLCVHVHGPNSNATRLGCMRACLHACSARARKGRPPWPLACESMSSASRGGRGEEGHEAAISSTRMGHGFFNTGCGCGKDGEEPGEVT